MQNRTLGSNSIYKSSKIGLNYFLYTSNRLKTIIKYKGNMESVDTKVLDLQKVVQSNSRNTTLLNELPSMPTASTSTLEHGESEFP